MPEIPLLTLNNLTAQYGDLQALFGVSLQVRAGEAVAIIGANGAGKSTLLNAIAGSLPSRRDAILLRGTPIGDLPANQVVRLGVALVPEGRRLFPSLSVEENLRIGGQVRRPGPWNLARIYSLFPILADRRHAPALTLSGGQQQMVAIGRALMSNPDLLLCDEISLGLAPVVVRDIYRQIVTILQEGTAVVIVEQDIGQALDAADHIYCLREGRLALDGKSKAMSRAAIAHAYFGI
jgi:branched-chain amino acid transport system ATP-binding protein